MAYDRKAAIEAIIVALNDGANNRRTRQLLLFEQWLREHKDEGGFTNAKEIREQYSDSFLNPEFWVNYLRRYRDDSVGEYLEQEKALATRTLPKKDFLEGVDWFLEKTIKERVSSITSQSLFEETGIVNFLIPTVYKLRNIIFKEGYTQRGTNAIYSIINQLIAVNKIGDTIKTEDIQPIIDKLRGTPTKQAEDDNTGSARGGEAVNNQRLESEPTQAEVDQDVQRTRESGSLSSFIGDQLERVYSQLSESFQQLLKGTKRAMKRKYYYTWWLFDSPEDFEHVKQSHKYPRSRGQYKVAYAEVPTKEIANALAGLDGNKDNSAVKGDFLGVMGLITRNAPFTRQLQAMPEAVRAAQGAGAQGPIIAVGVARAKAMSWRANEIRGLWPGAKMRFDISKLNWKWAEWKGKAAAQEAAAATRRHNAPRSNNSDTEPEFIVLPVTSPDKGHEQLDKPFGRKHEPPTIINGVEAKSKGNELSFSAHKKASRALGENEGVWYEVLLYRWADAQGNREIKAIEPAKGKVTVSSGNSREEGLFWNSVMSVKEWKGSSKKEETITPSFDCGDEFAPGTYRIYCLAKKTEKAFASLPHEHQQAIINDTYLSVDQPVLWDYNYIEFTIGVSGGPRNKKEKQHLKKNVEKVKKETAEAKEEIGNEGSLGYAPKEFLEVCDIVLRNVGWMTKDIIAAYEKASDKAEFIRRLKTTIAIGLWSRERLKGKQAAGNKKIQALYKSDPELKALREALPKGLSIDFGGLTLSDIESFTQKEIEDINAISSVLNELIKEKPTVPVKK